MKKGGMMVTHVIRYPGTRTALLDWRASLWSGLIAGAVFMMLEMIMVPLFLGMSAWAPVRMIAAIVMGPGILPPPGEPATFQLGALRVAMLVHFPLAIIYAFIGGLFFQRMATIPALIVGGLLGLLLYYINFYGFTAVFEWFAMARNWVSIFAHIVFGIAAAGAYKAIQDPEPRRG
jgi:hypothetical protein